MLHEEEIWWAQRGKTHWLKEDDKNIKFFHQNATQRNNCNRIRVIKKATKDINYKEEEI